MDDPEISIGEFWQRLSGSVHPDDQFVFEQFPDHSFNIDFPPPAFIGSIEMTPIVILMSNGGYDQAKTELEFSCQQAVDDHPNHLRGRSLQLPPLLSKYYTGGPFGELIRNGKCVLVNVEAVR